MSSDYKEMEAELTELRIRLEEANDTIEAIRSGEVDALVVKGSNGNELYTLKSADQTYRVFIENMNEGAITLNRNGLILYSNSRFAEMVNQPLSKVTGISFIDFVGPAFKTSFQKTLEKSWKTESKGEIELVSDDEHTTPVLFSLTTLELDEGTALSLIVADLSQQKEAEKELKQKNAELQQAKQITEKLNNELEGKVRERTRELLASWEHFKFLADNIPVIAWKALPDGTINYFNKRWYELTGYNERETGTKEWIGRIHPDDREATLEAWNESMSTANPFHVEFRLLRGNGDAYLWHLGNALPYKNEDGEVVVWFGIATDIEFQKKALDKKDEFINMVSHELKTPVTSLKGFTQLLMMSVQHDPQHAFRGYLATMNNQINKLTRLITDLLDATQFNSGQLQFKEEEFDFNLLASEIIVEMQLTTNKHILETTMEEQVMVFGDKNRIGQVITNLLSNAIKYSPNADRILISAMTREGFLEFCVQDFGIGIPASEQSKLYTRFFRVTDNNANTFPGMGLGLYISMGIIEKHHGTMWVKSERGKGSEFFFRIPLSSSLVASL